MEAESEIAEWYRGKAVFVTGATGFMGKVLIEKLLRSCPGIGLIYVLVREKKNVLPRDRVENMMSCGAFDGVRATRTNWEHRLIPIPGNISQPNLGISAKHRQLLQETVSVVFNLAATVRFDEPLRIAVAINLEGAKALMQLCLGMAKLNALVHVSTAYANCNLSTIEERVYAPPADPDKVLHCVAGTDDELLGSITPRLIGNHPNTYTFTKALAEHEVAGYSSELPIVVVRPSIVSASWKDPSPGWIDNFNGPTALVAAAGKGLLSWMYGKSQLVADVIPVDVCINLFIAAAWEIGTRDNHTLTPHVQVYNCTSGAFKSVSWEEIIRILDKSMKDYPFNEFLTNPSFGMTNSRVKCALDYIGHALPATIADIVVWFSGGIPRFRSSQRKLKKGESLLKFFVTHEFKFKVDNVEGLRCRLNPKDKMIFNFDVRNINWEEYVTTYFLGIRRHLMNEKDNTIHTSKQRAIRWMRLTKAIQIGILTIVGYSCFLFYS